MLQINNELCTGCGQCVDMCPFGALTIQNNKAVVDEGMCRLCGVCMNACAFGAMSMDAGRPTSDAEQPTNANANPESFIPSQPGFPSGMGRGMGGGRGRGMGGGMGRGMGGGRGRGMGGGRR